MNQPGAKLDANHEHPEPPTNPYSHRFLSFNATTGKLARPSLHPSRIPKGTKSRRRLKTWIPVDSSFPLLHYLTVRPRTQLCTTHTMSNHRDPTEPDVLLVG